MFRDLTHAELGTGDLPVACEVDPAKYADAYQFAVQCIRAIVADQVRKSGELDLGLVLCLSNLNGHEIFRVHFADVVTVEA